MAIDITTITRLISSFRKMAVKDSVSPETVGYLLQRLADLIATAESSKNVEQILSLIDTYANAGNAIISIEQGDADRNNVLATVRSLKFNDGGVITSADKLFIKQATTERAGAMRAQQVIDLNAARKSVSTLEKDMAEVRTDILSISDKVKITDIVRSRFSCLVYDGRLHILGAQSYLTNGYVPYIFRRVNKRHPFKDKDATPEERAAKKYGPQSKGWGLFGSMYAVKILGTSVLFSDSDHSLLCKKDHNYSGKPDVYVSRHVRKNGIVTFGWGRSSVPLTNDQVWDSPKERMIRLRFGIGFAKPMYPGRAKITPTNLVSPLAEFTVVYDPNIKRWAFST